MNKIDAVLLIAVLAICPVMAACFADADLDESGGNIETLANGGVLILNPATGIWPASEGWQLVEELPIGTMDGSGPDVFSNILSLPLAVDDEGTMFVLDGQSTEIRVFDASGSHLRTFGGEGAGPGEMRSASLAGWGPDGNLWVADPENARYSVFLPEAHS